MGKAGETGAAPGVVPWPLKQASHFGESDLPFVDLGNGSSLQLLQVDLNQGLWITRIRFQPGCTIDRHYHTGCVFAVTLKGSWHYKEYPESVNRAGSYLFEPAGSVHTLTAGLDTDGLTEVWFAVYGANVNLDASGQVIAVIDAAVVLQTYRALCEAQGLDAGAVLVSGE